jgi:hypothetical protein
MATDLLRSILPDMPGYSEEVETAIAGTPCKVAYKFDTNIAGHQPKNPAYFLTVAREN